MLNYVLHAKVFLLVATLISLLSGCYYSSDRLSIKSTPGCRAGTVEILPDESSYIWGSFLELRARPCEGWEFAGWSGTVSKTDSTIRVLLIKDINLVATFCKMQAGDLSCTETYSWEWEINGQPVAHAEQLMTWEDEVYRQINAIRTAHGLSELIRDTCIKRVARKHSREMAANNYLAHVNLNEEDHGDRLYAGEILWRYSGENLARFSCTENNFIGQCVEAWVNSPTHNEVLLAEEYTHTGVGIALDNTNVAYITQNFVAYHQIKNTK